LINLSLAQLD